jgi:hypothetical protein
MRPGEVFVMRWEYIFLGEDETGLIRIVNGKSKAAKNPPSAGGLILL